MLKHNDHVNTLDCQNAHSAICMTQPQREVCIHE